MKNFALIIEDDPDLADIFAQALQAAEFETETIRDGRAGLARLLELKPALVVLDLHLPNMTGPQILEKIRAEAGLDHTRVIVASADPLMADLLQATADLVLLKPISFSQLRDLATRLRPLDVLDQD